MSKAPTGTCTIQIGQDIDGEENDHKAGGAVAINSKGDIVVFGATEADQGGLTNVGLARAYQLIHGSWTPLGDAIYGQDEGEYFGKVVATNFAGDFIAVGTESKEVEGNQDAGQVEVYELSSSPPTWTEYDILSGSAEGEHFGSAIAIPGCEAYPSYANRRICPEYPTLLIGARGHNGMGKVTIYRDYVINPFTNGFTPDPHWTFTGSAPGDEFGGAIAISDNGEVFAVGATQGSSGAGYVIVYDSGRGFSNWPQDDPILGSQGDMLGTSVALSDAGDVIAVGSYNGGGSGRGSVQVWGRDGTGGHVKLGSDILGEANFDHSGSSIALSGDGRRLAVGAPLNDGGGEKSGQVRLWDYDGDWKQYGADIDGAAAGDLADVVAMSRDGSVVAIGSPKHELSETGTDDVLYTGQVRVFNASTCA